MPEAAHLNRDLEAARARVAELEATIRRVADDLERSEDADDPYYTNDSIAVLRAALKEGDHD